MKHESIVVVYDSCEAIAEDIVGELSYVGSPQWNTDNWVCIVSPNL